MTGKIIVMVTCGSDAEARRIARELVDARLAACVNILESPVRSLYRWKGEVESATEYLLFIKTSRGLFRRVRKRIQQIHSYDVPEIIAIPIAAGSRPYLAWLGANLLAGTPAQRAKARPASKRK